MVALISAVAEAFTALATVFLAGFALPQLTTALRSARVADAHALFDRLERIRGDRKLVRDLAIEKIQLGKLTDEEFAAIERVCRAFDILGLMDRRRLIPRAFVDEFYAPPLVLLWDQLQPHVERQRAKRGKTHYWELIEFHHRVQHVPEAHPGLRDKHAWPLFPRLNRRWTHRASHRAHKGRSALGPELWLWRALDSISV